MTEEQFDRLIAAVEGNAYQLRELVEAVRKKINRCPGCGRTFGTPQGLGLHFTLQRKKHGAPCSERPT